MDSPSTFLKIWRPLNVSGLSEARYGNGSTHGEYPLHWHREWQICLVERGDGWVWYRGARHRTPAGTVFVIPPGHPHANGANASGCGFRWVLVEDQVFVEHAAILGIDLDKARMAPDPLLAEAKVVKRFGRFNEALRYKKRALDLECELLGLAGELLRYKTQHCPAIASALQPGTARRARHFLVENMSNNVSLSDISTAVGLSPFALVRQFHSTYGMPPHQWLLQARIEEAKQKLRHGADLTALAGELGFSDQAHFTRIFRRFTGVSPGRYRKEMSKII